MTRHALHQATVAKYHLIRETYGLGDVGSSVLQGVRMVFFRGRTVDPKDLTPKANHFSYPPAEYCLTYGRANIPGFPVFYAGESPAVVLDELHIKIGDWLHLAVFKMPIPADIELMLLIHDQFCAPSRWADLRNELREHVRNSDALAGRPDETWDRMQQTPMQFRREDYSDTAAISHFWLHEKNIDAVVYPSIRNDEYCNFALSPDFVDHHVQLHCVHACRWTGKYLELRYVGRTEDGRSLNWAEWTQDDWNEFNTGYKDLRRLAPSSPE